MTGIEVIDKMQMEILNKSSKGLRVNIPNSINQSIAVYQKKYKEKYGQKISKENIVLLMLVVADSEDTVMDIILGKKTSSGLIV